MSEDDVDDERVWDEMCATVAKQTDLPIARVKTIADDNGLHAYGHCGIVDLLETVRCELDRKP